MELQPLTPREAVPAARIITFETQFIENARLGRGMNVNEYLKGILVADTSGVLRDNQTIAEAVKKSGQDPLIWKGVYLGAKECVDTLKNPNASTRSKEIARENLEAYFHITELTAMDQPPQHPNAAIRDKITPVWQKSWDDLNSWRSYLSETSAPERRIPQDHELTREIANLEALNPNNPDALRNGETLGILIESLDQRVKEQLILPIELTTPEGFKRLGKISEQLATLLEQKQGWDLQKHRANIEAVKEALWVANKNNPPERLAEQSSAIPSQPPATPETTPDGEPSTDENVSSDPLKESYEKLLAMLEKERQGVYVAESEQEAWEKEFMSTLNLPEEINWQTIQKLTEEFEILEKYPVFNEDNLTRFQQEQPERFERIFGAVTINDAFIKESDIKAGITQEEVDEVQRKEILAEDKEDELNSLLAHETIPTIEQLKEKTTQFSQATSDYLRAANLTAKKRVDLFIQVASKAGLKVDGFDDQERIRLVEQTVNRSELENRALAVTLEYLKESGISNPRALYDTLTVVASQVDELPSESLTKLPPYLLTRLVTDGHLTLERMKDLPDFPIPREPSSDPEVLLKIGFNNLKKVYLAVEEILSKYSETTLSNLPLPDLEVRVKDLLADASSLDPSVLNFRNNREAKEEITNQLNERLRDLRIARKNITDYEEQL